ncbi:hypothetical protein HN873_013331 [Arachis hypogaea]
MLKIKEDFDYKILSQKLEVQLDKLIAENERQGKAFDDEVEKEVEMSDGVHGIGGNNQDATIYRQRQFIGGDVAGSGDEWCDAKQH